MIRADKESQVTCETCRKPAVRRTLTVQIPGMGSFDVSYDTHCVSLTEREHLAAITRMEAFYRKAMELRQRVRDLVGAMQPIAVGTIQSVDFETVHPDACSKRAEIVFTASVRAFSLTGEARLAARPLAGLRADSVVRALRQESATVAETIKARYERGAF